MTARILCLGEVSWDRFWLLRRFPSRLAEIEFSASLQAQPQLDLEHQPLVAQAAPGGCALNTAGVLRAYGLPASLAGNYLGMDETGLRIQAYLKAAGIDSGLIARADVETPFCQVWVEAESGHRDFTLRHLDIQRTGPECWEPWVDACARGEISHAFVQPYNREISHEFLRAIQKSRGPWVMIQDVDPGSPFVEWADAVQISFPEPVTATARAPGKASYKALSETDDGALIAALAENYFSADRRGRCQRILVTAGGRGVALCERGRDTELFAPVVAAEVKDTTGCGDAFRAGLMAALYRGQDWRSAVGEGQRAGAIKAGIYGSHFLAFPTGAGAP